MSIGIMSSMVTFVTIELSRFKTLFMRCKLYATTLLFVSLVIVDIKFMKACIWFINVMKFCLLLMICSIESKARVFIFQLLFSWRRSLMRSHGIHPNSQFLGSMFVSISFRCVSLAYVSYSLSLGVESLS